MTSVGVRTQIRNHVLPMHGSALVAERGCQRSQQFTKDKLNNVVSIYGDLGGVAYNIYNLEVIAEAVAYFPNFYEHFTTYPI